jgi:hypothetical protein
MATDSEILSSLRMVTEYYGQEVNETQVRLWLRLLEPYPALVIEKAVVTHIERSKWTPKVSEIRDLCAELNPSNGYRVDSLVGDLVQLENAFYDARQLDPAAWERLARRFERVGRVERAANTRQRLANLQAILNLEAEPC